MVYYHFNPTYWEFHHPTLLSYFSEGFSTTKQVSISVVAAVCVSMRHPPSTYIRHAIWSIWGIWMLVLGLMLTNILEPQYDPITIFFARHLEVGVKHGETT